MEFVIKISQFLLSLSLLIVLHELGHFIPAKLFKTRVEKFYLFFDVKYSLFKKITNTSFSANPFTFFKTCHCKLASSL